MKQFWACQPRAAKSASASSTPAWIFSAVMPGGSAGSEKSTVAGSRPINTTRFIDPPLATASQRQAKARDREYLRLGGGVQSAQTGRSHFPPAKEVLPFPGSRKRELPKLPPEKNGPLGAHLEDQRGSRSRPSVHLARFGPQTGWFLAMAGLREDVQDWLAERSRFELVGPFCQEVFSKTRWEAFAWEFRWRFL